MRTSFLVVSSLVVLSSSFALAQHGPPRGPPQEALTACNGLSSGAACGFTHDGRNLTGTCRAGPNGEALACAPAGRGPGGGPGGHHQPPQEAITACSGLSSGASCTVAIDGRTLTGTCGAPPDGSTLACRPPRGEHRGPPPEALAACSSLSAGASCSVTFDGKALSGTCVAGPNGEALACLPARFAPSP